MGCVYVSLVAHTPFKMVGVAFLVVAWNNEMFCVLFWKKNNSENMPKRYVIFRFVKVGYTQSSHEQFDVALLLSPHGFYSTAWVEFGNCRQQHGLFSACICFERPGPLVAYPAMQLTFCFVLTTAVIIALGILLSWSVTSKLFASCWSDARPAAALSGS